MKAAVEKVAQRKAEIFQQFENIRESTDQIQDRMSKLQKWGKAITVGAIALLSYESMKFGICLARAVYRSYESHVAGTQQTTPSKSTFDGPYANDSLNKAPRVHPRHWVRFES
jgi:hypothetical protein